MIIEGLNRAEGVTYYHVSEFSSDTVNDIISSVAAALGSEGFTDSQSDYYRGSTFKVTVIVEKL